MPKEIIGKILLGGYDKANGELEHMKTTGRAAASKDIAEAREKGDLSENAEYHAAKDAQGLLEAKINELEKALANVRIIDASQLDNSTVTILSNVRMLNLKVKKEITYQIVSETEADLKNKRISVNSPIAKALLAKAVGDVVDVMTPAGAMQFEILEITL